MNVMLRGFLIVVWLFSSIDFCSAEEIIIERENSKDVFTVPPSKCRKMDYCATYNAMEDSQACRCYCPEQTGTFSIYNNRWTCVENEVTRSHLGCSHRTLFLNETSNQPLSLLRSDAQMYLSSLPEDCRVNFRASWFIACDGKKVSFTASGNVFDLSDQRAYQPSGYKLKLDLPDMYPLLGRVVNLGIRCTPPGSNVEDSCLLFKLEGEINCSATVPQTTESTIATSTTNVKSQFKVVEPSGSSFTASPSAEATNGVKTKDGDFPSPAADRNSENGLISASVAGIIAGVNGFIILVMFVIGICIYRRNHSRSHPGRSISGGTAESFQSNSGFNTAETTSSYATVNRSDCGHYASIYRVPNDVRNDAPRSVEQPLYNIIEELATSNKQGVHENRSPAGLHDNAPFSVEQRVYGLIESIDPAIAKGPHEHRPPIGHQDNAPFSVEQRLYSLIENIDTAIVKSPPDHSSSPEGQGNTASFSVDQRVYNIIEDLDSRLYEELNSFDPEQPEYHVLEGTLPKGAEEGDCVGSSDEHARSSE